MFFFIKGKSFDKGTKSSWNEGDIKFSTFASRVVIDFLIKSTKMEEFSSVMNHDIQSCMKSNETGSVSLKRVRWITSNA